MLALMRGNSKLTRVDFFFYLGIPVILIAATLVALNLPVSMIPVEMRPGWHYLALYIIPGLVFLAVGFILVTLQFVFEKLKSKKTAVCEMKFYSF